MAMPLTHDYFTADMVRALPDDGKRYELVDGELLVTPAPQFVSCSGALVVRYIGVAPVRHAQSPPLTERS